MDFVHQHASTLPEFLDGGIDMQFGLDLLYHHHHLDLIPTEKTYKLRNSKRIEHMKNTTNLLEQSKSGENDFTGKHVTGQFFTSIFVQKHP